MNILVLQPVRPSNPPELRAMADALLARLQGSNSGMQFDIRQDDTALAIPPHPSLYMRHATVRNYMLDTYLKPEHDMVFWVDSDLIDYPADLPTQLITAARQWQWRDVQTRTELGQALMSLSVPAIIIAPLVLLSETSGWKDRFYDIGGFIEHGNRARIYPPWFEQNGDVIELDSVGCCYLAPAELYRWQGVAVGQAVIGAYARYAPPPTDYYVEHWSVMQQARKRGYRICCLTTARAVHAWLPDYGLEAN